MYKNIMVAIDDSDTSRCALTEALHIAKCSDARLYITHVADETLMGMHGRHRTKPYCRCRSDDDRPDRLRSSRRGRQRYTAAASVARPSFTIRTFVVC